MIAEYLGEGQQRLVASPGRLHGLPRRAVVTGAAGFIGSHLVDTLLAAGCDVTGIDNFDPWYEPEIKRSNLAAASAHRRFTLISGDLSQLDAASLFAGADVVFHLAARPGVQDSWGSGFSDVCQLNIALAQQVFEAALEVDVSRVVYASSSSVYGNGASSGCRSVAPISPYGVSKAAGEQLAAAYGKRGLDIVSLRFFTVFGPRQRPDMAMHRLFQAAEADDPRPFLRRGDGEQQREFTFVGDVVEAAALAGRANGVAGRTFDVGGGCTASLNDVIATVHRVAGRAPLVLDRPACPGDPELTAAQLQPIGQALGWKPSTSLQSGLEQQWAWHRGNASAQRMLRLSSALAGRANQDGVPTSAGSAPGSECESASAA